MVRNVAPTTKKAPLLTIGEAAGASEDFISVFGKHYDVVNIDSMGLRDRGIMQSLFDRVNALEAAAVAGTVSDAEEVEYDEKLRSIVARVLPTLPAVTLAAISTGQCAEMCGAFFVWRATRSGAIQTSARLISESSSRDSHASTAAANGSSPHRTPSSGRSRR